MIVLVVGGVIKKDNKFLLVQEAKEECFGKWNLPAGRLDEGETIFEGALREINEETGLQVELQGILEIGNKKLNNADFVSIIFHTSPLTDEIKFDYNEIMDAKWFTYDEIMNMKENLRSPELIIGSIEKAYNNKCISLDLIKIVNY